MVAVSSVPPLILGHLLHFAAMPPAVRPVVRPVRRDKPVRPGQDEASVSALVRPDKGPGPRTAGTAPDKPAQARPVSLVRPQPVVPDNALEQKRDLTELVRSLRDKGHTDEDEIKKLVRDLVPDVKPDSLRKAIARTRTA